VLKRGFALVTAEARLVAERAAALPGAAIAIEFHDGSVTGRIDRDETGRPPRKTSRDGGQGSLL
jgi:exonuclease VII large subunit